MKISIVIPAHNEAPTIANTIRAVLAQDYHDFEVIIIDNASDDDTSSVAQEFPVKVVREERKGLLWARERGRNESTGDIIANIDADCIPETDWLSRAIKHFENDHTMAVTGPYDYYDGAPLFRRSSLITQKHLYQIVNALLQSSVLNSGAILIGGNNLIRANILSKMGGYNTALTFYGEDTDTAKRVARHGRVVFDKNLIMKTSARRFKSHGTIRLILTYWWHFFKHIFSHKK